MRGKDRSLHIAGTTCPISLDGDRVVIPSKTLHVLLGQPSSSVSAELSQSTCAGTQRAR